MHGCTIVARNYLPMARVLAESFLAHHPTSSFTTLIMDDPLKQVEDHVEPFSVVRLDAVGLESEELHRMAMIYNVTEFSTAVKPWLLAFLKNLYANDAIVYLDPDICFFDSIEDVAQLALEHSIVLTPHTLSPMAVDDLLPSEQIIMASGTYNLGFIGLGPGSESFLGWWSSRLRRGAIIDPDRMLFTDQRWVDLVPGYYDTLILRDETCNVAYWNLDQRPLDWNGQRYTVNGKPLRFFHFSGYDPDVPHVLSKHMGNSPRILLSDHSAVARICREYSDKLRQAGFGEERVDYFYDRLPNGVRIDTHMRRAYRAALIESEKGKENTPPNPFNSNSEEEFLRWLNEPTIPDSRLTRYLAQVYHDRADLQQAFPQVPGLSTDAYLNFIRYGGKVQLNMPDSLVPPLGASKSSANTRTQGAPPPGVNVAGYFRSELGVGEAGRLMLGVAKASGENVAAVAFDQPWSNQGHPFVDEGEPAYDINLVCINADQVQTFAQQVGRSFFSGRYSIGYWHWEVSEFPLRMLHAFGPLDEVWVASTFVSEAVKKVSPRPVFVFPPPILLPNLRHKLNREELGLPDCYLFLFMFDFLSVTERKNPLGLLKAFSKAFRPGEGPVLVIKVINSERRIYDLERLRDAIKARPDVVILDRRMSLEEKIALVDSCDCYVSLHRSEGFGLTMAEAMAAGKPVIATGYSGNLEFMTSENSLLVPYSLVPVPEGCDPYPKGALWAEPDTEVAADFMRRVYEEPLLAAEIGTRAKTDVQRLHSVENRAAFFTQRLDAVRKWIAIADRNQIQEPQDRLNPLRRGIRLLLRPLQGPVQFVRYPPPAFAGIARALRPLLRPAYRRLLNAATGKSQDS